jgi:hypothetical protein
VSRKSAVIAGTLCAAAVVGIPIGALAVAVIFGSMSMPLVPFPEPSGSNAVGTSAVTVANGINLQIWYPASSSAGRSRAPYRLGSPRGPLRIRVTTALVKTNAFIDPPVAPGNHPVLLYAPSWGSTRSDNSAQAENLASHGFVVVAMDDLYPERPMDFSSPASMQSTLRWANEKARLQARASLRVLEALDIAASDVKSHFYGHLDFDRVGMYGFSFGGAVAAEAASLDSRIRAAADLDGWIFSDAAGFGVPRPFMIMSTSAQDDLEATRRDPAGHRYSDVFDKINFRQMTNGLQRYGGYFLSISGTQHFNFSDAALLPSFRRTGLGSISGARGARIVATYLTQFFGRYLNDTPAPLLEVGVEGGAPTAPRYNFDPAARLEIWQSQPRVTSVSPIRASCGRNDPAANGAGNEQSGPDRIGEAS